MNISLVFCMGRDYQTIIDSPIGQPMATVGIQRVPIINKTDS